MSATEPRSISQMTPREAWEAAWEQAIEACRHAFEEEATARGLEVFRSVARQILDQEPEDAPVAAHDEAAELRAAIKAWAKATKRARVVALARFEGCSRYTAREVSQAQEAEHEAEERLYGLAASEGQP